MILHNYIFKQVFITTLNITVILFSMIWLIQSLRQIDLVIETLKTSTGSNSIIKIQQFLFNNKSIK